MAFHTRPAQPSASRVDRGPNVELPPDCKVINNLHEGLADPKILMPENQRNAPPDLAPNVEIGHTWRRLLVANPLELSLTINI